VGPVGPGNLLHAPLAARAGRGSLPALRAVILPS
jgi:hypothetical protein